MSELLSASESIWFYKPPIVSQATAYWILLSRKYHIVYNGFLHNHMTHNLAVIGSLGLDEEQTQEKLKWWYELYSDKKSDGDGLEIRDDFEPKVELVIDNYNWKDHVLCNDSNEVVYYSYLHYFDARIKAVGYESVVQEHLPFLVSGLAGSALHPIIHLGFGLEIKNDLMIAEGLAALCIWYLDLGHFGPSELTDIASNPTLYQPSECTNLLEASLNYITKSHEGDFHAIAVAAMETAYASLPVSGFQRRLRAYTDPQYLAYTFLGLLPLKISTIFEAVKQATTLIACAYLASDNEFFVIHGLTSLHGLVVSMQFLSEEAQKAAVVCWWKATMAVLVVQSIITEDKMRILLLNRLQEWQESESASPEARLTSEEVDENELWWKHTLSIAVTSHDEHASKGCYVLYRWSQFTGMPAHSLRLFREVAANQIKGCPEEGTPERNIWFSS